MKPPETIVCVDCGGPCFLLSHPPPDDAGFAGEAGGEFAPGDVVAYRCRDCNDRWDVVMPEDDDGQGDGA